MIFMTSIIVGMTDSEILLRVLREVGLVDVREDGRHRLYRLNGQPLKPIHDWLRHYERMWNARFDALGRGGGRWWQRQVREPRW
jgi:hypothetical protein